MNSNKYLKIFLSAIVLFPLAEPLAGNNLRIFMQERPESALEAGKRIISGRLENWEASETAIIITDMWDKHWCAEATARVGELAPEMNKVISIAREKGVKIVHAPSDCMGFYASYPGRKEAAKYLNGSFGANANKLPSESNRVWPVDQSDEGCECDGCSPYRAWKRQIESLTIRDEDLISDNGNEIGPYFKAKGVKNVILMGVHTNMCIVNRSFGLRAMKRMGMNVVLMRDMTDLMYNDRSFPYVNRFAGLDLVLEYIESYIAPSIVSTCFTGEKQVVLSEDKRPRVAFLIAENETRSNQYLPEFARELTLTKDIHCEFALLPEAENEIYDMENLQILENAGLAICSVNRQAIESGKMDVINDFIVRGGSVFRFYSSSVPSVSGVTVSIAGGKQNHPLLKNVSGFVAKGLLQEDNPAGSDAEILLYGNSGGDVAEPVFLIDDCRLIYTSLGYWEDWEISSFRNLMFNATDYLLNIE